MEGEEDAGYDVGGGACNALDVLVIVFELILLMVNVCAMLVLLRMLGMLML